MKPAERFLKQPKHFWANVRAVSQETGYTDKHQRIKAPTLQDIQAALGRARLSSTHIVNPHGRATKLGKTLHSYFRYRAEVLNGFVEPRLMDRASAKLEFERLRTRLCPKCPLPMNKQTGEKKAPAYLTGDRQHADRAECGRHGVRL